MALATVLVSVLDMVPLIITAHFTIILILIMAGVMEDFMTDIIMVVIGEDIMEDIIMIFTETME